MNFTICTKIRPQVSCQIDPSELCTQNKGYTHQSSLLSSFIWQMTMYQNPTLTSPKGERGGHETDAINAINASQLSSQLQQWTSNARLLRKEKCLIIQLKAETESMCLNECVHL